MLSLERELWDQGYKHLAGVDEAGRGPLAGPVVACAVVMDRSYLEQEEHALFANLTDSKKLTERRREYYFELLTNSPLVRYGLGVAEAEEIDKLNILRATHVAMARALSALEPSSDMAIIDGLPVKNLPCPSTAMVGGDGRSLSVAAASIIAKVTRDRIMKDIDSKYPAYGFGKHKGYGSAEHIRVLLERGPCPIHRRSFSPVKNAEDMMERAGAAVQESLDL